jgi:hypothetical protein
MKDVPETGSGEISGLTDARATGLERVPTRSRESALTLSSWRLSVVSAQGEGAIVLAEISGSEPILRGEGVFLGWSADRLRAAYEALRPRAEEPPAEMLQLG